MIDFCDLEGFDRKEIENVIGIRLKDDGDRVFISDEMVPTTPRKDGQKTVDVLMRWFNFNWAVMITLKETGYSGRELINTAINYAKRHCFDGNGEPFNLAKMSGYTSYSKFNLFVEENLKSNAKFS